MVSPMQIGLEEIISMLLQKVETLSANEENSKTKSNIIYRVLYNKGLLTEEDILESVRTEYHMLKELGAIPEEPKEEMYKAVANGIMQWIKGDIEGIKTSMKEYEEKLKAYAKEEAAKKPKIEVANANVLNQLDAAQKQNGKKLII